MATSENDGIIHDENGRTPKLEADKYEGDTCDEGHTRTFDVDIDLDSIKKDDKVHQVDGGQTKTSDFDVGFDCIQHDCMNDDKIHVKPDNGGQLTQTTDINVEHDSLQCGSVKCDNIKCDSIPHDSIKCDGIQHDNVGPIVGTVRLSKSKSCGEVVYENVGAMDLNADLENVETMEDCIFFDTAESVEDDHIESVEDDYLESVDEDYLRSLSYDKNSLLDSGINADELLCVGETSIVEIGAVISVDEDTDQNSREDEEVELIMSSSDVLDRLGNELRQTKSDRRYEDVNVFRKRSKSNDETISAPARFDFARYGISIGINSANDLLPGIEEFLSTVLAKENLSEYAEEQRLYFLERLDIIKLPPSIPPRPQSLGIRLYPLHSSPPPKDSSVTPADVDDFAAYQRELSRALVDTETSPEPGEVKVYDDIDISDISFVHEHSTIQTEEESVYEIPQAKSRNLSGDNSGYERAKNRTLSDSGYEKALDISQISKAVSLEGLEVLHGSCQPPPLPPRRDRAISDAASRSSIGSIIEEKILELNKKNKDGCHGDKFHDSRSERSTDDILDEGTDEMDGLSYDSMEDTGSISQLSGVQLPKPTKKRRKSQRRRIVQSLTNMKEVAVPLRNLEDVLLTGELHYRSKLTWTRKIVALTNGRMICYKPDKIDSRPLFVILLTGYSASFQKREGKRSFEINLTHENFESHMFLADFKEWAETWCEYIKYAAQGRKPPGPVLNLTRATFDCPEGTYQLGKSPMGSSGSNLSLASSDGFDTDPGTVKVKKRDSTGTKTARMGSFAFRATQFFESLGKKSSVKKTSSGGSEKGRPLSGALSQSSLTEETSPLTPESGIAIESPLEVKRHVKHQGYLDIYSNFNKRKWGKRWCMVHDNSFECYRTQTSEVCELEFYLHNCVLRRAIEETKSELGLMLLENNREKITIEPLNWTELGSWLRVLMRETSTSEVPDGLAGYMDDTNPYHEAVEVTRLSLLSDPFSRSPTTPAGTNLSPETGLPLENSRSRNQHRDSGNCSSESMDGKFGSLERLRINKPHPSYTDSSLPRVTVPDSGDLYTQIRKHSETGSVNKSPYLDKASTQQRSKSEGREPVKSHTGDIQVFDFSFEGVNLTANADRQTEGSLMDEIMSQFRSQIPSTFDSDTDMADHDDNTIGMGHILDKDDYEEKFVSQLEGKSNLINVAVVSDKDSISVDSDSLVVINTQSDPDSQHDDKQTNSTDSDHKPRPGQSTIKKTPSLLYGDKDINEVIEELRTKLVQLKKDRISIRDRKLAVTSDIDREYLEAEFNRLNRECDKVAEEIKYLEKVQKLKTIVSNKDVESSSTKSDTDSSSSKSGVAGSGNDGMKDTQTDELVGEDSGHCNTDKLSDTDLLDNNKDKLSDADSLDNNKNLTGITCNSCDDNKLDDVDRTNGADYKLDAVDKTKTSTIKFDSEGAISYSHETASKVSENEPPPDISTDTEHELSTDINKDDAIHEHKISQNAAETVHESIVTNDDLVNKANIVDTNVIIVEPDSSENGNLDVSDSEKTNETGNISETEKSGEMCGISGDALISSENGNVSDSEKTSEKCAINGAAIKVTEDSLQGSANEQNVDSKNQDSDSIQKSPNIDELMNEDIAHGLVVVQTERKESSSDSENGVIKDLANDFEQKLRLESESDC